MVIRGATQLLDRGQSRLSWPARAGSVAAGLALAQVLPEPPNRYHPVAWFGSTMERAEQRRYRDDRFRGVQHTTGPVVAIRSEEHTSELQSHSDLVCRLL